MKYGKTTLRKGVCSCHCYEEPYLRCFAIVMFFLFQVLSQIPVAHRNVFKYICAFLRELLSHSDRKATDIKVIGKCATLKAEKKNVGFPVTRPTLFLENLPLFFFFFFLNLLIYRLTLHGQYLCTNYSGNGGKKIRVGRSVGISFFFFNIELQM